MLQLNHFQIEQNFDGPNLKTFKLPEAEWWYTFFTLGSFQLLHYLFKREINMPRNALNIFCLGNLSLKIHNIKFDITVPPGKIGTFMSKT